jgi:UPF0755 protein
VSGGRGAGGGPGGYPGPGYGGADYGDEPQWDDSVWQRDQPDAWPPADADQSRGGPQGYDPQGYDPQAYDPQGYNGPGYGGQDYDRPGYAAQPYPGQPYENQPYEGQQYEGQPYEGQGYPDRGVPGSVPAFQQQDPPPGPQRYPRSGPQPAYPGSGAQPAYPGTGAQSAYPGSGPYPAQPGQRGPATGSRPVQPGTGGLPQAPAGYEDPRWEQPQGDDSFLPGFGPRDGFEGGRGRGQDRPGNGGRGRGAGRGRDGGRGGAPDRAGYDGDYNGYDDPRAERGTAADPRRRAPQDPRDPRDPREPAGYPGGPGYPAGPARPDARRQQGLRPDGPDPRTRDPRRDAQGGGNGRGNRPPIDPDDRQPRRRRRSPIRRLAPWIALLVIVIPLALVGWHIYGIWKAKTHPADYVGAGTAPTVTVQVQSGETADQLAPTLYADGVIASTRSLENAADAAANGPTLEPGYFELRHHMQASLAWADLTNPKNMLQTVVTIPEGKRVSQVISILSAKTAIPLKDFQQVIDHPKPLGLPSYAKGIKGFPDSAVEGFLFPATYAITPHETALQILQAMVARFNVEAQAINITAAAQSVHLSVYQLLIEASMAQAEGGSVTDYPKIATVIKNRLSVGMTMGFDSVLFYGLNAYGINVTPQQEAVHNPYNDMTEHTGLPPTPIDNPGDAAIQGILHPTPGNWLYFLTVSGGKSVFSHTPLKGQ